MTEENKRPVEATEEVQYNDNHDASSKKPKFEILSAPPSIEPAENERLEALWREISSNPTKRKYDPQQTSTGRQNASAVDSNGEKAPAASTSAGDKAKKKKVALYMSYSGTGYVGMQMYVHPMHKPTGCSIMELLVTLVSLQLNWIS